MLRIEYLYALIAALLACTALFNLRERRFAMAAFWVILAAPFALGDTILAAARDGLAWPSQAAGIGVIALGLLAAGGRLGSEPDTAEAAAERRAGARRLGNRLFWPALSIPVLTLALFFGGGHLGWNGRPLLDPKALTLSALAIASLIALGAALRVTRAPPLQALGEGRRLVDALGWAILLPMVLATLGGVFAATGVGEAVAELIGMVIPTGNRIACLLAFAFGMVFFTVIMGNAFAAFPVMMAGIGLPLLIRQHGADPALLGAVGMLTGYCGTLLTPMAANFNIVPAVLLELPDQHAVIRAQIGTALPLLAFNIALMAWLVFR